jgi:predicted nucleic acid-binding protein
MMAGLNPKFCNIFIDANALDKDGSPRDYLIDKFDELQRTHQINIVMSYSVRKEVGHPRTPTAVKNIMLPQIFTLSSIERTSSEENKLQSIRKILRGNACDGKHDADGLHLFEADKYGGGYFITHDKRILDKRGELRKVLNPSIAIVTLVEFLEIYDKFAVNNQTPQCPR